MKSTFKLALVQQACNGGRTQNLAESVEAIRSAKAQGADLVMLPELHLGPYFCQTEDCGCFDGAEAIPGPTTAELASVARALNIVVVASLFERRAPGLYHNTAVVLDSDGSLAGKYRKMHIPDDPGYYEKFYFTPGDLGFRPIDTSIGRLGVLVCWDQWYPEAARLMALAGADLLLYPTAIGWNPADDEAERARQLEAWVTVQRGHAVANGLTVAACNRIGSEPDPSGQTPGILFWGNSFAAGPQGEFICRGSSADAELLMVEVDRKRSEDVRRIWPFLRDRRIDSYEGLLRRYLD
ncbi:carbon-nitrogen hydrolase [Methylococcus geothermalis]|uniref:Acyltransferase n=1 Tax=Methylococcus geothermalis TaxID=2681310 RepID=A0A858Q781_9GAMM|nr:carbon-nitrogen hydrolase [Methylococcus geothermalis]QJD29677.1 acyltransferase [Methylococcus geothermalis]